MISSNFSSIQTTTTKKLTLINNNYSTAMPKGTTLSSVNILIGYDPINNGIQIDLLRPLVDLYHIYNLYENHLTNVIANMIRQREISLPAIVNEILATLPTQINV